MKDIVISVTAETSEATPNKPVLAVQGEHLQSQIIVEFSDTFIDGTATLEYKKVSGAKGSLPLTKNDNVYKAGVTSDLTGETPNIKCQVKIVQQATEQGTPIFKSKIFEMKIAQSIDA